MPWSRRDRFDGDRDVATERSHSWDGSVVFRLIAAIAAGVMLVIGLIAVARVSWGDNGFDAAPVDVAGMIFTPEVGVVTAAAGLVALIAAAFMLVIGLIAVARVSWGDNGFDAAPVDVAGIMFTPEVAVVTAAAGLVALIAAAFYNRTSKLIVGGVLVCAGIVGLLVDPTDSVDWFFEDGHAWLAIGVGAALIVVALLMQMMWTTSGREVRHHHRPVTS